MLCEPSNATGGLSEMAAQVPPLVVYRVEKGTCCVTTLTLRNQLWDAGETRPSTMFLYHISLFNIQEILPTIAFRGVSNFERELVEKLRATFES